MTERPGSIVGLDHVQLPVPEDGEDAVRSFYVDLLGLSEVRKPPALASRGGVWLTGEGVSLHFGVELEFRPWRKAHVAMLVDGLAELRARLEAHGVRTTDDDAAIDARRFYAEDPFGNRLELVDRRDGGFSTG